MKAILTIDVLKNKTYDSTGKTRQYFCANDAWYYVTPKCLDVLAQSRQKLEKGQPWLVEWFDSTRDGTTFHNVTSMQLAYDMTDKQKCMLMLEQILANQQEIMSLLKRKEQQQDKPAGQQCKPVEKKQEMPAMYAAEDDLPF